MTKLENSDLCIAIIARMAEQSGTKALTCKLTHAEILELVGKYEVTVTRNTVQMLARSFEFATDDEYTLEFKEKARA
jgi:hypothetical protein